MGRSYGYRTNAHSLQARRRFRGLVGEIIARFERRGYIIAAMKLMQLSGDKARAHYAEHEGKPFFAGLVEYITSGPLVAMVVEGEDAIEALPRN